MYLKESSMRSWIGGIKGIVERLDALKGRFNEKMVGKVGMYSYLFEGRFDEKLKGWDVLEGMFNENLERLGCT